MTEYSTELILNHLLKAFPYMQEIKDFEVEAENKQSFINKLYEMHQMDLIEAIFLVSAQRETYGVPYDVMSIKIVPKGREYMEEKKKTKNHITQNINIGSTHGPLQIAGQDINISNGVESEKIIEKLLNNIDRSNLPPEKKKYMASSIKDIITNVSSSVLAALIIASVG